MEQDFFADPAGGAALASAAFEHDLDCLPIAPILAGARARRLADAFETLGIVAIFVGPEGEVLFASERTRSLLGASVTISGERLEAAGKANQRALDRLIKAATGGSEPKAGSLVLDGGAGVRPLRLHAAPLADNDPYQLLRAVLVVDIKS